MTHKNLQITPISEKDIESYHKCLDTVARERKYLGFVKAPSLDSTLDTVRNRIIENIPLYVVLDDEKVVGWCEIIPNKGEGFYHSCTLNSMGLLSDYRGKAIGKKLIDATLLATKEYGFERVELMVYASNRLAIGFYEKIGFVREGVKSRARKLDNVYDDVVIMALFI